ncbi:Por secretion system C-terminal sorting domain-containing protein [Flaviramulus basaltis]|uniref:Por secretion system C-terminal sorting domain-containing protein n=1 Tax=Flaviramulus basaltis TaxID=369401 RepID=A0A1K2INN3_9FLAO|nr:T9SS type A sorting domain-containing protein [Flaviramulus basaltis]SFZ94061.1 Por secretion system C-terminal sorting domain-containing protein [Flaviramulus basaltis]
MTTIFKTNKKIAFFCLSSITFLLIVNHILFIESDQYIAITSSSNYSSNNLNSALNSQNNKPINALIGPGLTKKSYTELEVGQILSQNDTGGKAVSAVLMHNGYLFVPLGADHGGGRGDGAFSFYDISDQENPVVVFDSRDYPDVYHNSNSFNYVGNWGEVHSLPVIGNRMVITETDNGEAGFSIFDTSNFYDDDPNTLPQIIGRFRYPGVTSPTNYDGYSFSLASKGGKYVYAPTGAYGLYIVDITDPTNPTFVNNLRTAELSGVFPRAAVVLGDILVLYDVNAGSDLLVMDITDPANPVQLAHENDFDLGYQGFLYGSEFFSTADGSIRAYDISDPSNITTKIYNSNTGSEFLNPEYGFGKDNNVFIGHYPGLTKWDLANPNRPIARCEPSNPYADDYAFLTPLGNTAVITSDHGHTNKLNFGVHQAEPDNLAPAVKYILPKDGSASLSVNTCVGISFTDFIDPLSINDTTLEILNTSTNEIVSGTYSQMFGFVNFVPNLPLDVDTTYEVVLKDEGIKDWSGNAIGGGDSVITTFSTGPSIVTVKTPKINKVTDIYPGDTALFSIDLQGEDISEFTFSWDFGDGSLQTAYDSSLTKSHQYDTGGNFVVTLYVKYTQNDKLVQLTTIQAVTNDLTDEAPSRSAKILYDDVNNLVWNVNPDNNSVSAISATNYQLIYEIAVGENPKSLALASNNELWVVNKNSATISIIDTSTGTIDETLSLDYASSPVSILIDNTNNTAYIALQSTQKLIKYDINSKSLISSLDIGPWPKSLALDASRNQLWIARFISPEDAGKLTLVNTDTFTINKVISLQPSTGITDSATNGRGLPNYLGALAISPDGTQMFVPSKKDNIYRGIQRDGLPLTFEASVRSMGAQIDLDTGEENFADRVDFNNSDFATAAAYSPNGSQLFVTTNGTSSIWIVDAFDLTRRSEISSGGDAPDDLVISPDGKKIFVHNFMSRSVVAFDSNLACNTTCSIVKELSKTTVVTNEKLTDNVLLGKQLFYNSYDTRLSTDGYMSCASCHLDGTNDGRIWDFTNLDEGFRNTIDLKGKGKKGHGRSHWSSNFDEIHDFENQIRIFSLGSGLMSNSDYTYTQNTLGHPKKGISKDLDALAAYVESLDYIDNSPYTNNGELTPQAEQGKIVFNNLLCMSCHGGADFTDSPTNNLHDIGTIKATSGKRLGGDLLGIDTPTLRGLWLTAPYLHDGSASTIRDAIEAHTNVDLPTISVNDMDNLVTYLLQISDNECLYNEGDACNDRDPNTINDVYNDNCECIGEIVNDCNATGQMLFQRWDNISGTLTSNLTRSVDYPYNPTTEKTITGVIDQADSPDMGSNYGTKISGILCAPQTGYYTFWISGDDSTELYLSTDKYPSNAVLIANTGGTYTGYQQWDLRSSQESTPVYLEATHEYSFILLHKEGDGGDHFSAGWKLPNGTLQRPMPINNFSKPPSEPEPTYNCDATGEMLHQRWDGITGTVTSDLTSDGNYPDNPTTTNIMTGTLDQEGGVDDNYGSKVSGILCAPETGNYIFWVSGDDSTELYLSTDENPSNGVLIAETAEPGGDLWTNYQQWDKNSNQQSAPIFLEASHQYSFILLHKEGDGGDHFSAGWTLPSGTVERPMALTNFSVYPTEPEPEPMDTCDIFPMVSINGASAVETNFAELAKDGSVSLEPKTTNNSTNDWSWYGPNGFSAFTQTIALNNIQANQEGTYEVYHTNADNCVSTEYYYVKVNASLGIDDVYDVNVIKFYPNPTSGLLIIESSDDLSDAKITVTDINGRQISRTSNFKTESSGRIIINSSNWSSGLYFVSIENNNKKVIKKIVRK